MKPRHVPLRTCVICREKRPKSELQRVVRTPEGEVKIDPTGKLNGRGGYVCMTPGSAAEAAEDAGHWGDRQIRAKLGHALKVELTREDIERLSRAARSARG